MTKKTEVTMPVTFVTTAKTTPAEFARAIREVLTNLKDTPLTTRGKGGDEEFPIYVNLP